MTDNEYGVHSTPRHCHVVETFEVLFVVLAGRGKSLTKVEENNEAIFIFCDGFVGEILVTLTMVGAKNLKICDAI